MVTVPRTHEPHADFPRGIAGDELRLPPNLDSESEAAVKPLPPAHSVGASVRALNVIMGQLSGDSAIQALRNGDCCSGVDVALWSPAWEGARNFRDHFVLSLSRHTRDEWRRDVNEAIRSEASTKRPSIDVITQALDERLRITLGFAFRFLTPRHVCFLADALMLAFESEMKPAEFSRELATSASQSTHASKTMLDALVLGASGMHRYQPERVMASVAR